MTEETQYSLAYDKFNVKQASAAQHFVVGDKVVPANVQEASSTCIRATKQYTNPRTKNTKFPLDYHLLSLVILRC